MKSLRKILFCSVVVTVVVVVTVAWMLRTGPVPRAAGPLPHEAYVWQRAWTPAVRDAVRQADPNLSGLTVLVAEVSFERGRPRVVKVPVDYDALLALQRRVGLALRIGPCPGPFDERDAGSSLITGLVAEVIAHAREAGLEPVELQIDFDCAEKKLDGYRVWLEAIRRWVSPTPVTITALPCWLDRRAFGRLVEAADGYVLQVHSIQRPEAFGAEVALCDPTAARKAVERAARFGKPFRVALPTYGYVAGFDKSARLLGMSAEGQGPDWPGTVHRRVVRSDPEAMAKLVRSWAEDRPEALSGIIWFRLPVASDRLNWSAPALSAVMNGQVPLPKLRSTVHRPKRGLVEIGLLNEGADDASTEVRVVVTWQGASLVAADALGEFHRWDAGGGEIHLVPAEESSALPLRPGQERMIGWMRLSTDTEVEAHVSPLDE